MPAATAEEPLDAPPRPGAQKLRLHYLDGLRGLAALYVALFHAHQEGSWPLRGESLPPAMQAATQWITQGHYAVAIFIVLSGYSLMIPVARSGTGRLRGGFGQYLLRRARRILPPYYAALGLTLLLLLALPELRTPRNSNWDWALPAFTPGVLISHLLMLFNLNPAWAGRIDPPMWSVATEWQIYFIFPLILLPLWRFCGLPALVAGAFALGVGLKYVFAPALDGVGPWYIGLFALGMAAATLNFSPAPQTRQWEERLPWPSLSALGWLLFAAIGFVRPQWLYTKVMVMDTLAGAATAALLVACARSLTSSGPDSAPTGLRRILEARPVIALGGFSYSLYLIHAPALAALRLALEKTGLPLTFVYALVVAGGLPISLALAYGFYLVFERRFKNSPG